MSCGWPRGNAALVAIAAGCADADMADSEHSKVAVRWTEAVGYLSIRIYAQRLLCDAQTLLARGVLLDLPAAVAAAAELQPIPALPEVQAQVRYSPV